MSDRTRSIRLGPWPDNAPELIAEMIAMHILTTIGIIAAAKACA